MVTEAPREDVTRRQEHGSIVTARAAPGNAAAARTAPVGVTSARTALVDGANTRTALEADGAQRNQLSEIQLPQLRDRNGSEPNLNQSATTRREKRI